MGATDGACAGFRQSPVQYLSLLHQILDRSGNFFHRHVWIDTVLVQKVNIICTQPPERPFHCATDMVGTAVQSGRLPFLDPETELRADFHFVTERSECPDKIPTMMNYTTLLNADSMYNTPDPQTVARLAEILDPPLRQPGAPWGRCTSCRCVRRPPYLRLQQRLRPDPASSSLRERGG